MRRKHATITASQAVRETIEVLEQTKSAFKSKQLGELRHRLELLLEHV